MLIGRGFGGAHGFRNKAMINTKHLRSFIAVARAGSAVRAGSALGRVPSATARAIRELERELDTVLFERHPRGMILSHTGRILYRRVEAAFAEMELARGAFAANLRGRRWTAQAPVFALAVTRQRLLAFVNLAEQHSMTAVAVSMGISQPAVSQSVGEIETSLGLKLFQPMARGMVPTPLGALLALHTKRALAELRVAEDEIGSSKGVVRGSVLIGTLSLGRTRLLPLAITQLQRKFPDLTMHTEEGSFEHLATRLREGEIDCMLGALRPPEQTRGFERHVLVRDTMSIIVRAGHPLARRSDCVIRNLADVAWVLPRRGTPTRDLLTSSLTARGLKEPRVQVETADLSIMLGVLLNSDLVTAASLQLFRRDVTSGALVALPIKLPETARQIGVMTRAAGVSSTGTRLLIDALRAVSRA
jgi:LysR family transcriptional regulator of gallate degradation